MNSGAIIKGCDL